VSWSGSIPVYASAPGMPRPGVGSNGTPSNHTSGQAWALRPSTWNAPSSSTSPCVNPTATRAGIPSALAIAANVPENCSQ
jgi:hypothetical protein